jgi:rhomboid protease GluP
LQSNTSSYIPAPVPPTDPADPYTAARPPRQWLFLPTEKPIITQVLLVILVAIYLPMMLLPDLNNSIINWGALEKLAIIRGEWWRLITATFLHGSQLHIALNGYALYIIGKELEAFFGRARFVAIYAISALAGSVASFYFLPYGAGGVGASGAIFGVFGALAVYYGLNRRLFGRFGIVNFRVIIGVLVLNLVLDYALNTSGVVLIDISAHVGGLLAGGAVGFLLAPRYQPSEWRNPLVREIKNINNDRLPWIATLLVGLSIIATFVVILLLYRGNYIS